MGMDKEMKKVVRAALKRGWLLEQGRRHYTLVHPYGRKVAFSCSPSDGNAYRGLERDIFRVEDEIEMAQLQNRQACTAAARPNHPHQREPV